jgi:hypothetical protein
MMKKKTQVVFAATRLQRVKRTTKCLPCGDKKTMTKTENEEQGR